MHDSDGTLTILFRIETTADEWEDMAAVVRSRVQSYVDYDETYGWFDSYKGEDE